jgi:hypothetical protein
MSINKQVIPCRSADRGGWYPRRKARTRTALVGDRAYELRPTGLRRAQLRRNGELLAEARGTWRSYNPFRSGKLHQLGGLNSPLPAPSRKHCQT